MSSSDSRALVLGVLGAGVLAGLALSRFLPSSAPDTTGDTTSRLSQGLAHPHSAVTAPSSAPSTPPRRKFSLTRPPDTLAPLGGAAAAPQLGNLLVTPRDDAGANIVRTGKAPSASGPVIVGVAGASGSGKTSIATLMSAQLVGHSVVGISLDR